MSNRTWPRVPYGDNALTRPPSGDVPPTRRPASAPTGDDCRECAVTASIPRWAVLRIARAGCVPWLDFSGFNIYYKLGDMLNPGPSQIFVFLDERVETLGEGVFYLSMDGSPDKPGSTTFYDYPACAHNGAGSFSFGDGHVETKKWLDPRTIPARLTASGSSYPPEVRSPNNPDIRWLQDRCTRRLK